MTTPRYIIKTRVIAIEERFKTVYVSGSGADVVNRRDSRGWFVQFEGSYEMLFMGFEEPVGLNKGGAVRITIEKE